MRIGVLGIDGDQAFELARRLVQLTLTRKRHTEVVERVPVVRVAVEGTPILDDGLPQPPDPIKHRPEGVAGVGVVQALQRAPQNRLGLRVAPQTR